MVKMVRNEAAMQSLSTMYRDAKKLAGLAGKHSGDSVEAFSRWLVDNLKGGDWYGYMFAMAVFCRTKGAPRVDIWDTMFATIIESKGKASSEYKDLLNSYYEDPKVFKTPKDVIMHCLYVLWHDTPVTRAINIMILGGFGETYEEAYPVIAVSQDVRASSSGNLSSSYASDMRKYYNGIYTKDYIEDILNHARRWR